MSVSSLDWSSLITGGDNTNDPTVLYSDSVRTDSSGNAYTLSLVLANAADSIRVCNSDGSVFGSFAYTGNGLIVVKRNSSGVVQWYGTGLVAGNNAVVPADIDVDSNGNLYACGWIYANITFAGTSASSASVTRTGGSLSAFLAKWNSSGVLQFAINPILPTAAGNSLLTNLRCYNNEVYCTGSADPNLSYNIQSSNSTTFRTITLGSDNGLFIKYNSSGTVTAAFKILSTAFSRGLQVDVDSSGNVYIGGRLDTSSTTYTVYNYSGGTEVSSSLTVTSSTGWDSFIIKYNSTFTAQWIVSLTGTGNNDLLSSMLISSSTLLTSLNVSSTSLIVRRNNGTISTLATLSLASTSGSVLLSFDLNGGLTWNARTEPSGTGSVYIDSYTVDSNGLIYITGTTRATGVIYRSPANVTTTINRTGYLGDIYIICVTSAGEYSKHWYIKNANSWNQYFTQSFTSDITAYGSKLLMHINDGYAVGNPSLKSLLNNTLVVAFKITTNSNWARIFDFCLGNSTNSYILFTGNGASTSQFRVAGRWQSATETVLSTGVTTTVGTQYVLTMYIQASTCTFFIYSWNGSAVTQVYTGTMTYSNGGGSTAPLNQLRTLWFGRSSYTDDVFLSGSFQKVLMYTGQIPTPATTLPLIFTSASANSASGSKYTFGAASGYTAMSVNMYNSPTNSTSEVTLTAGSRQYLALTDLTMLEEDATRLYDSSNNVLGTIAATDKSLMAGLQTVTLSLNTGPSGGAISGTSPIGFNTSTTLTASNTNGTLQWQSSSNNSTWTDIAGATSTTYTTPAQTNGTYYYRVVATFNGVSANSSSFTLVVDPQAIAGSISGSLGPVAYYGSTSLTLSGNTGNTLQWQNSFDNMFWYDVAGATTSSYTASNLTVNTFYRVRVNNGTSVAFTNAVTVSVSAPTPATSEIAPVEFSLTLASGHLAINVQASYITSTRIDNSGNMYIVGHTASSGLSISGTQGGFVMQNEGASSGFVGKYNISGVPQWGRLINTPISVVYGNALDVDASLNAYVLGTTATSGTSVSGTFGNFTSSGTGTNMYIVKYTTSGTPQWAKLINNVTTDNGGNSAVLNPAYGLAATQSGHVYIVGQTSTNGFTLSGVSGGFTQTVTNVDAFIAMYNNDVSGTLQWARRIVSGSGNEYAYKVAADAAGNAYVFGNTNSSGITITGVSGGFTKGNASISPYFAKYDMTGTLQWARQLGDASGTIRMYGGTVDGSGNVYGVGYTNVCGFTISGVSGGFTTNSTLSGDSLIVKYDTNGVMQWARNTGSTLLGFEANYGVTADINGNIYVTGTTNGIRNTFSGASGFARKSVSGTDSYVAQFDTNGNLLWGKFIPGFGETTAYDISVNAIANRIVVAGATNSKYTPNNQGGYLLNGGVMVAKLDNLGSTLWTNSELNRLNYIYTSIDNSGCQYSVQDINASGFTVSGVSGGFTKTNTATSYYMTKQNASGVLEWGIQPVGLSGIGLIAGIAYNPVLDAQVIVSRLGTGTLPLTGVSGNASYTGTGTATVLQAVSASGTLLWNNLIGNSNGAFNVEPYLNSDTIFVDRSGFTYVTGSTSSGVTISGLSGFTTGQLNAPGTFVTKHDTFGRIIWAQTITMSGFFVSFDTVCADANGSVNVVGKHNFSGYSLLGLSGGFTAAITHAGSRAPFVAQYNNSGTLMWGRQIGYGFGTSGFGFTARGAVTDVSNNMYILANITGGSGMTISGAVNNATVATQSGVTILAEYDLNGNPQWVKLVTNNETDSSLSIDNSGNTIVKYGTITNGFSISGSSVSGFTKIDTGVEQVIVKYSPTIGDVVYWERVYGAATTFGYSPVNVDSAWNMYTSFASAASITFSMDFNNTASGTNNISGYNGSISANGSSRFGFLTAYNLNNVGQTSFSGVVGGGPMTVAYNQSRPLTVSGTRGAVQWQSSPDNSTWSDIVGATDRSYVTTALTTNTHYRVRSTYGSAPSAFSASILFTVNGQSLPGTISGQLPNPGFNTTRTLTLTGASGVIQWQSSTDGLNFTNIASATNTTYTTPALTASTWYRTLVQNGVSDPVFTTAVRVVVDAATVAGSITGTNRITTNSTTNLTLGGFTANWFQWQSSPNASTWTDITGASGTTYTTPTLTANTVMNNTASTLYYYRVNTRNGNSTSGVTSSYTVTVDAISVAGVIGVSSPTQNAGYGTTKTLTLSGYTGTIQWQTLSGADYASIAGATSATYNTPPLTLSSHSYRAVVTNGVSPLAIATPVTINVDPQSVPGTLVTSIPTFEGYVNYGDTPVLSLSGSVATAWQWQSSANNSSWSNISGATASTYTFEATASRFYRVTVTNLNSPQVSSSSISIGVYPYSVSRAIVGTGLDREATNIAHTLIDNSGNTYIAGSTSTSGFTISGVNSTFINPSGSLAYFICEYNASGTALWARGTYDRSIMNDAAGNLYTVGVVNISGYTLSGSAGGFTTTSSGSAGYVSKYDSIGTLQWATLIQGVVSVSGNDLDIGCDASGFVYAVGNVSGAATVSGAQGGFTNGSTSGIRAFAAKFDGTNGVIQWGLRLNSSGYPQAIAVDKNSNNFAVAGWGLTYYNSAGVSGWSVLSGSDTRSTSFDGSGNVIVGISGSVNKYNPSGVLLFSAGLSGANLYNVAGDETANTYVAAGLSTQFSFSGTYGGSVVKTAAGLEQGIFMQLNASGAVSWSQLIPGIGAAVPRTLGVNKNKYALGVSIRDKFVNSEYQYNYSFTPGGRFVTFNASGQQQSTVVLDNQNILGYLNGTGDSSGSVYYLSYYLNASVPTFVNGVSGVSSSRYLVSRYNANGQLVYANTVSGYSQINGMAISSTSGYMYLYGNNATPRSYIVVFNGLGQVFSNPVSNEFSSTHFIDPNYSIANRISGAVGLPGGTIITGGGWQYGQEPRIQGSWYDAIRDVSGRCVVLGGSILSGQNFVGTSGGFTTSGTGQPLIAKYQNGPSNYSQLLWARQIDHYAHKLVADQSGTNYYSLGLDTFKINKYNDLGTVVWTNTYSSASGLNLNGFKMDTSGFIYVGGSTSASGITISGAFTKTDSTYEQFIVKIESASGNVVFSDKWNAVWATGYGIPRNDLTIGYGFYSLPTPIILNASGYSAVFTVSGTEYGRSFSQYGGLFTGSARPIAGSVVGNTPNIGNGLSRALNLPDYTGASVTWQSSLSGITYTDIVNSSAVPYTITNASGSFYYRATVTGNIGSALSTSGVLVVTDPPSVAGSISGPIGVTKGLAAALTTAGNTGTLQWQSSADNVTWANISGATSASYTTARLFANTYFRVAVTNLQSPTVFTSGIFVITSDLSNPGAITGGNVDVLYGATGPTLTVVGITGTIQWQSSADNGTWSNISGATASTYATGTMVATTYYRVAVTNGGSPTANSVSVGVFVDNNKKTMNEVLTSTNLDSLLGTSVQFNDVSLDANGNMFVVGNTGLSGFTLSGANGGFTTANASGYGFVAKYNSSGVVDWARLIGAGTYIAPTSVFYDANGLTHIVGRVSGAAGSISGLSGNVAYASRNTFYAQFNATGTLAWSRLMDSTTNAYANKVFVNSSNLICIVNQSSTTANIFTMNMCGLSGRGAGALNASANDGTSAPYGGAMDSSGNMWLTGIIRGATVSGVSGSFSISDTSGYVMYASYINSSGVPQWNYMLGNTPNNGRGTGVAVDQSGNSYFTGIIGNAITISGLSGNFVKTISGNNSMVLVKYNRAGLCQWAQNVGTVAAGNETVNNLTADAAGNVWLVGFTQSSGFTMSGLSGGFVKVNTAQEGFIANYNPNGTLQWAQLIRGYGNTLATGIAMNLSAGRFAVAGNTNKFGSGALNYTISGRSAQSEMILFNYDGFGNFTSNAILTMSGAMAHAMNQSGNIVIISNQSGRDIGIFNNAGGVLNRFTTNAAITPVGGIGYANDGSIYYTGTVNTASLTVSGLSGGFTKAANANTEICLTSYDSAGNLMWSRLTGIQTTLYESQFDYSGNSYVFGRVSGFTHMRIEKWLPNGTLGWGTNIGFETMTAVQTPSMYVNASGFVGVTYATNVSGVTLTGAQGGVTSSGALFNVYVGQLNNSGVVLYGRRIGTSGGLSPQVYTMGHGVSTNKLIGDSSGNLYVTASSNISGVTLSGGSLGNFTITGPDFTGFIQKFNSTGDLVWGRITGYGGGAAASVLGTAIDRSGNVTLMMDGRGSAFTISGANRMITTSGNAALRYYNITLDMNGNTMNVYPFANGFITNINNNNLVVNMSGTFTGINYNTESNMTVPLARTTISGIYNGFLNSYNLRALGGIIAGNDVNLAYNTSRTLTLLGSYGTLQWQSSADGVSYSNITGATSATYTTPNLTASTFYRVQVTDTVNGFNATSVVALVTVDPESVAGTITGAETSAGYNTGKTLTLSGNVGTVQWQSSANNTTFSNIPSATSTTYTTPNLVSSLYFRAVVTSGVNPSVNSTAVQVVVDAPTNPGIITISSVAAGAQVPAPINTNRILVLRNYVATSIQWQQSADGVTYSDIGGATADTYATENVVARVHYRARLQNGNSAAAFTQPLLITAQVLSAYSSLVLGAAIQNTQVTNLRSTALDNTGNLYVIGDTNASGFTLSGAQGGFTVSGAAGYDAFIAMYNSSGAVQWARLIASAQTDTGYGVTTDTSGNIYAVASVGNVGTISGISGGFTKTTTDIDSAFIKYSASGTVIMARLIGAATYTDTPAGLTVDTAGNVFIAGTTNSSGYTLSGAQGGFTTSGADSNAFIVEYDIAGTIQWARLVGALGANDFGFGVSIDPVDSSVYMTGVVATSGYTLSGVSGGFTKVTIDSDAFLAKYSASGVLQYGRLIAGLGADFGYGVSNDSSGNAFVVGYTASSGITLSGPMGGFTKVNNQQTAFVAKYSGAGAIQWARQIGVSGVQSAFGVSCDPTGYVWVTGITTESGLTISGVSGGLYKTNNAFDSFVVSYDSISGILNRAQLVAGAGPSGLAVAAIAQNTTINRIAIVGGTATTNTDINYAVEVKTTASPQTMIARTNASGVPLWNAFTGAANPNAIASDSLGNSFVVDSSGILRRYDITGATSWSYTLSGAATLYMNIATDRLNNVWVTGFSSTSGFTMSGAGISGFIKGNTNNDSFIAKISNNSGVLQWAQLIPNTNQIQHVATDTSGSAIVGINTTSTSFSMSGISGSYTKAHTSMEYVVLKYSASGVLQWVKQISPSGFYAYGSQLTCDVNNQIVIAGYTASASGLTISGTNGRFTTSGTNQMLYAATLNPDSSIKWAQLINTNLGNVANATNATDASGFVYTLCPATNAVTISGISGGFTKSAGAGDIFVTKHESVSGVLHWGRLIPRGSQTNGIQVDTSGFVYVMGQTTLSGFNGSGVFATKTTTTNDTFVMKFDPFGALQTTGYYYYNTNANDLQFKRSFVADGTGSVTFATSVSGSFNMYNWPDNTYGFAKQYLINPQPVAGTISGPAVNIGYNKTTTLSLTGNAGTIQWQSSTNGTSYSDIAGATSATYTTPTLTASAWYRVAVTNGPASPAISDAVQVVVDAASVAGTISGETPNAGYNKTKTLTLAGNTGTIQWQSSTDNITFSNIVGATSATYTTPALTATQYYRVVVTSGNSDAATSTSVTVAVDAQSVAGTLSGPGSNVGYNKATSLTVTGNTGTLVWYSSTDNSNFSVIAGQTSASYMPTLTATTYFYVTATSGNSDPATSSTVTVTVDPASVAGTITGNRTVVLGTNNTTLTVSGNTGTIQWQSSTDNVTFTNIAGATNTSYNAVNLMVTTYYRVVVTNGASDAAISPSVTMTVISYVKPDAPTSVTGEFKNASVLVSWTPPAFDGNKTITGYVIKAYLASDDSFVSTTPYDSSLLTRPVTGLTNGTAYKFTVSAVNVIGTSDESAKSSAVTPSTTAPAPTGVSIAIDDNTGVATVSWTPNPSANSGSAITGYRVAVQPGDFATTVNGNTASTTSFNLVLYGALYSATVASINGNGTGTPSAAASDTYDNPIIIQAVQDSQTSPTAISDYSQSVQKTPTELFLELKATAKNQLDAQSVPLTQDQNTRTQIANAVADKASVDIATTPLILVLTPPEASVLYSASVTSIPLDEVRETVLMIPPLNETLQTATVDLTALQSTLLANGVDLATGVSTADLHVDVPPNYETTLTYNNASLVVFYDGATLTNQATNQPINVGDILFIGTAAIEVKQIGSFSFTTLPPYVLDVVGNATSINISSQKGMNIGINNAFGGGL